ncbi:hypothetical protein EOM09_05555 [bacterium]|nr:hypothetical protein [bacterium]
MTFKKIIFLIIISGIFLLKIPVFAENIEGAGSVVGTSYGLVGCGEGKECTAEDIFGDSSGGNKLFASDGMIVRIFNLVMGILGSVVFLYFIYGGILLMTSRGDKGKINKAKTIMTGSITGLAIIFFSYAFVQLLLTLFLGDFASNYLQN